jgi:hypothetical protein
LAHKIFVSLIKKHSDYGRPARRQRIGWSQADLAGHVGVRKRAVAKFEMSGCIARVLDSHPCAQSSNRPASNS